jgi:hypothetical protein
VGARRSPEGKVPCGVAAEPDAAGKVVALLVSRNSQLTEVAAAAEHCHLPDRTMPRKKTVQLPSQGDAFAVPLADGRYSVCRVILDASSEAARQNKSACVLVASSAWIGAEVPKCDDPALRPILCLTHHASDGERVLLWVSDPVPAEFIPLGRIPPTPEEAAFECDSFSGWAYLAFQSLRQWRWDHDRAAVLEEDQAKKAKAGEKRQQAEAQRQADLARVTLSDLANHKFFPRWKGHPAAKAVRESRDLMASTVRRLIELGESASEDERKAVLQACIESFNELDAKLKFIATIEREDICEEFEAIVHACGLGRYENLADEWRDW